MIKEVIKVAEEKMEKTIEVLHELSTIRLVEQTQKC